MDEKRKKKLFSVKKSTELLREMGDRYFVTTWWNPYAFKSIDAWHLMDIQVLRKGTTGIIGINACGEDVQSHIDKFLIGWKDENTSFQLERYQKCICWWGRTIYLKPCFKMG